LDVSEVLPQRRANGFVVCFWEKNRPATGD